MNFIERFQGRISKQGKDGVLPAFQLNRRDVITKGQHLSKQELMQEKHQNKEKKMKSKYHPLQFQPFCLDDDNPTTPLYDIKDLPPKIKQTNINPSQSSSQYGSVDNPICVKSGREKQTVYQPSIPAIKYSETGFIKLGGLGANIGGEAWQYSNQKRMKMKQYSEHLRESSSVIGVKLPSHHQDGKVRNKFVSEHAIELSTIKQRKQKAFEYAKQIPRPKPQGGRAVILKAREQVRQKAQFLKGALFEYEQKHMQLKDRINRQL